MISGRATAEGRPPVQLSSFLLCLGFVLDLAAISLAVVILRVVLHLARVLTTSWMILAVFRFHFARITAAATAVFCFGIRRALVHRTRTAVATARFHCTASLALFLIALSGGLCNGCCKRSQQQRKEQYQDSVLSGFHFSSPVLKIIYRVPVNTPVRPLRTSTCPSAGRSLNQKNTTPKVSRTTVWKEWTNLGNVCRFAFLRSERQRRNWATSGIR